MSPWSGKEDEDRALIRSGFLQARSSLCLSWMLAAGCGAQLNIWVLGFDYKVQVSTAGFQGYGSGCASRAAHLDAGFQLCHVAEHLWSVDTDEGIWTPKGHCIRAAGLGSWQTQCT